MHPFKLFLIGSVLGLGLLSSCSDDDKRDAPHISTVTTGKTARVTKIVEFNGIFEDKGNQVFLIPESGGEIEAEIVKQGGYHLDFRMPADFPLGNFTIKVVYDERTATWTEPIKAMAFDDVYIANIDRHTFGRWNQVGILGEFEPDSKFYLTNIKDEKQVITMRVNEFLEQRKEVKAEIFDINEELVDPDGDFKLSVVGEDGKGKKYEYPETIVLQGLYHKEE